MYEENRTGFVLKDILLQIILVVVFVFLLLWLFPTKGYVDNKIDESLNPIYQELFNDHLQSMKEAAQSYYTTSRLPKKVGDKVSITLGEMLDKKLISTFVDSNNKQCSLTGSYVEITKMDNEYMMKVNLSCSDKSDYIIVYMGCYNYCESDLCEKKTSTTTSTNTSNNNGSSSTQTTNKTYQYEYELVTDGKYGSWSKWSSWSTNKATETDYRDVETKTNREVVSKKRVKVDTETYYEKADKDVTTKTYSVKTSLECPTGYTKYDPNNSKSKLCVAQANTTTTNKTNTVTSYVDAVATTIKVCPDGSAPINDYCPTAVTNSDVKAATASTVYGNWTYVGRQTFTGTKVTTATTKYTYVSSKDDFDCTNACKKVTKNTYDVYTRTTSTKYSCDAYPGYTLSGSNCVKNVSSMVHVYGTWTVKTQYSCSDGSTPVDGKCLVATTTSTPVSNTSCPNGGSYDSSMGVCYVRGTDVSSCPVGIDGEVVNGKCVVENVKYTCDEGTLVGSRCKITKNVYETKDVYGYVTYYRYRTREYISGDRKTTWSSSQNDKNLFNQGYSLTGKKKEVTKS